MAPCRSRRLLAIDYVHYEAPQAFLRCGGWRRGSSIVAIISNANTRHAGACANKTRQCISVNSLTSLQENSGPSSCCRRHPRSRLRCSGASKLNRLDVELRHCGLVLSKIRLWSINMTTVLSNNKPRPYALSIKPTSPPTLLPSVTPIMPPTLLSGVCI